MMKVHSRRVVHRLLKPMLWRWRTCDKAVRLSDSDFCALFPFRQERGAFLQDFHDSARLRFFFHPRNKKDFFLHLLTQSESSGDVIADAQDVLDHKFAAFGSGTIELGSNINWQRDFRSGYEWPMAHLNASDLLDVGNTSDIKIPWELNRFHQSWWLGKAYWTTNREEYPRAFVELVDDWISKNPVGLGPNWSIAMEVAVRACNWIAGYYLFCDSPSIPADFWLRFFKSLYAHGLYIEHHLEYAKRNGNHLLADVVALLMLGVFFRSASFGKRWANWGADALHEEMQTQVYPDGVNYEKSIGYHRLVLELFYTAAILCQKNNIPLQNPFLKRLEKMFEFTMAYSRPDGSAPVIGDADDARLYQFSPHEDFNDHRHALSVGSIMFNRPDFRSVAGKFSQDALWLYGGEGFERHQMLQASPLLPASRDFPDGGYYVMRSADAHVFIDAGEIGMRGRGGHGHNDTFSFELWCDNHQLIVDSGTFTYSSDVKLRNEFRGLRAHNTLMVDSTEIADFTGLWSIRADRTSPRVLLWRVAPDRDTLQAEHFAYQELPSRIVHQRTFELTKSPFSFGISDLVKGSGSHHLESFLHFAPEASVELQGPQIAVARIENARYIVTANSGELSVRQASYSRSYGVKEPNRVLVLTLNVVLPAELQITIRREKS